MDKYRTEAPHVNAEEEVSELAAHVIAHRYGLTVDHARVVAELAGLGSSEDRTPSSGGRS